MLNTYKIVSVVFAIFVLLSILCTANAQTLDELSSVAAFLSTKTKDKTDFGTGFFIGKDEHLFLVTASHVSQFLSINSDITIRAKGDKPFSFKFSRLVNILGPGSNLPWIRHTDADIAILPLSPDIDLLESGALRNHFLSISYLYDGKDSISRDITLTVLGFPLALGVQGYFSPISRETKPASGFLVLTRGDTKQPSTFFITQDPSIGGYSGAPVFDLRLAIFSEKIGLLIPSRQDKPRIVGIVHGTLEDNSGGKLGAVTPSYLIKELIDSVVSN